MTKQELLVSAEDKNVSDQQVFENLKKYIAEWDNLSEFTPENIAEYEEVSTAMYRLRPEAMEMLRVLVVEQHKGCCCRGLE